MALHAVASLLTSTLAPITNVGATTMAFVTLFLGVFGLYFLHFRVVYWALRYVAPAFMHARGGPVRWFDGAGRMCACARAESEAAFWAFSTLSAASRS